MYDTYQCKLILLDSQGTRITQERTFYSKVNVHGIPVEKAEEHREVCICPVKHRFLK